MRIKIVIIEKTKAYLEKLTQELNGKYQDKFEVYAFTDLEIALDFIESQKVDLLLVSDVFDVDFSRIPKQCAFLYFVSSAGIETINEKRTIYKFQQLENIYKQVLSYYVEYSTLQNGVKFNDERTKLYLFAGPSGGVGTSTMAASFARYLADNNKSVLYLNFEKLSSTKMFFMAQGKYDMSDIIYALKSNTSNLIQKLDVYVRVDKSGVSFFEPTEIALDMYNAGDDLFQQLVYELKVVGSYDYIVLDFELSINENMLEMIKSSTAIIFVGDGMPVSNLKTGDICKSIAILEESGELKASNKLFYIYNRYNQSNSKIIEHIGFTNIGGVPYFGELDSIEIISKVSKMDMFKKIM